MRQPLMWYQQTGQHIRSACCDATLIQCVEYETELYPLLCSRCGSVLEVPGVEDCSPQTEPPYSMVHVKPTSAQQMVADGYKAIRHYIATLSRRIRGA